MTSSPRLNTLGFLPGREKRASVPASGAAFVLERAGDGAPVFTGKLTAAAANEDTGESLCVADFSAFRTPGRYRLAVAGAAPSPVFRIGDDVYDDAFRTVMRGMYLWRCGTAVQGTHNGKTFSHGPCHRDDAYLDFVGGPDARKDATGGWHDAGDYNKYIVNAGVTVGVMFLAWEHYGDRLKDVRLGLPDASDALPDYLDEMKFEIDWVLRMQAADGSVYHKVSTTRFGGFLLPERETARRYITPWSSAATADFVAMTAQAARIFRPYDAAYAERCLQAARKSYAFLVAHPEDHRADLQGFSTGAYQTSDPDDRLWAAAEMWETTGEKACLSDFETRARAFTDKIEAVWDWGNIRNLGMLTYLLSKRAGRDKALVQEIRASLLSVADGIVRTRNAHGYARPLGSAYYWGANGTVARQVVLLRSADRVAANPAYIETSLDALGHLFGRNVYGRSFVTGLGADPPKHPHDRRSGGDDVDDPWPGYLVGGGWPRATDWRDEEASYQTNEIAINWNGALVYALAGFVGPRKG